MQTVAPLAAPSPPAVGVPKPPKPAALKPPAAAKPPKPAATPKQSVIHEGKIIRRDRAKSGQLIDRIGLTDELDMHEYEPDPKQLFASLFGGARG
jgi:hypothetical protein